MSKFPPEALEEVRYKGEIDWIEIRVTLSRPSQFRHVQRRLMERFGKTYVTPCEGEASSRSFEFRVQDPVGADQLMLDLQTLTRRGDPPIRECDVEIIGIEIALDGYIKGSDPNRLAAATAHFVRHLARVPAGPMRATSRKHFRVPESSSDLVDLLAGETSINMGGQNDNFRVRAYRKYYDTIAGARVDLDLEQHRARIEVTLAGENLPFTTIDGWRGYPFQDLSKPLFAMCRPAATDGLPAMLQGRIVQLGRAADAYKIRPSHRRKRSAFTRADTTTNEKIRKALISLTKRQSGQNSEKKWAGNIAASEGNSNIAGTLLNTPKGFKQSSAPSLTPPLKRSKQNSKVNEGLHGDIDTFLSKLQILGSEDVIDVVLPDEWGTW